MIVSTPDWVKHSNDKHKSTPIYSLHVHPSSTYLVTGGQDFKIKVWSMLPLLDQAAEDSSPKLMSTLVMHTGAVLAVRWSPDGEMLASGSDDTKIIIWAPDASNFGGFGVKNLIGYRAIHVLTGHESDVVDLAWTPDHLASCGLDCKVNIWHASSFGIFN